LGYQVLSGVKAGDKVVTLAYNPPLKDGRQVEIKAISNATTGGFGVDTIITKPPSGGSGTSGSSGGGVGTPSGSTGANTPASTSGSTPKDSSTKLMPAGTTTGGSGG
jgi:hypothetical protein